MKNDIRPDPLPPVGSLALGSVYRRADLNNRFGGNRVAGIVPSKREPVILLFHTEEPLQQFYRDGFDRDGTYWYSGEGTTGDMKWTAANQAIRDHAQNGVDLLLFERVQRKDGLWRLVNNLHYSEYKIEERRDKTGKSRLAIVFGLQPLGLNISGLVEVSPKLLELPPLDHVQIRETAASLFKPQQPVNGSRSSTPGRRSANSGPIGRRAEEIAHRYICENAAMLGAKNIRWVAKEGLTPGWDLQYDNDTGELSAVEVRGTTNSTFANVELTAGEWQAACALGDRYWLFLVAQCCGAVPQIYRLQNPASAVQCGQAQAEPVLYRFSVVAID